VTFHNCVIMRRSSTRAVSLLVTLLFLHYGLPSADLKLDTLAVAIIALSVASGANICEAVRAGIQSIDAGRMSSRTAVL
jgi:His/Glu/Gln/Arg/opine family amino acid ABC transporter permease subunit